MHTIMTLDLHFVVGMLPKRLIWRKKKCRANICLRIPVIYKHSFLSCSRAWSFWLPKISYMTPTSLLEFEVNLKVFPLMAANQIHNLEKTMNIWCIIANIFGEPLPYSTWVCYKSKWHNHIKTFKHGLRWFLNNYL